MAYSLPMSTFVDIRRRQIGLMQTTVNTLGNILSRVSQQQAITLRDRQDGPKGWSILEVVCHLRDFDLFFVQRARMMVEQVNPQLPAYDHEALAIERAYNREKLADAYWSLAQSREKFVVFFMRLNEEDWERSGIHPERGPFSMLDALIQVGHHDCVHIEQITRILSQR